MSIARKVKAVERLFGSLEVEIAAFKSQSSLSCLAGCGRCCTKPDIEATPLEFLPFAFDLFLKGKALEFLERIEADPSTVCLNYTPLSVIDTASGSCGTYAYRGLICRLFGYAASRDKHGKPKLATCTLIKESQRENYDRTVAAIDEGMKVPHYSDYYSKLTRIDHRLGSTLYPINESIKQAIEAVLHHYAYRPFPGKMRRAA